MGCKSQRKLIKKCRVKLCVQMEVLFYRCKCNFVLFTSFASKSVFESTDLMNFMSSAPTLSIAIIEVFSCKQREEFNLICWADWTRNLIIKRIYLKLNTNFDLRKHGWNGFACVTPIIIFFDEWIGRTQFIVLLTDCNIIISETIEIRY